MRGAPVTEGRLTKAARKARQEALERAEAALADSASLTKGQKQSLLAHRRRTAVKATGDKTLTRATVELLALLDQPHGVWGYIDARREAGHTGSPLSPAYVETFRLSRARAYDSGISPWLVP